MAGIEPQFRPAREVSRRIMIFRDIDDERERQKELKAAGKFDFTCADREMTNANRLSVLAEEFGEVAHATNEGLRKPLREELVQVAAVAVAWIEFLDS